MEPAWWRYRQRWKLIVRAQVYDKASAARFSVILSALCFIANLNWNLQRKFAQTLDYCNISWKNLVVCFPFKYPVKVYYKKPKEIISAPGSSQPTSPNFRFTLVLSSPPDESRPCKIARLGFSRYLGGKSQTKQVISNSFSSSSLLSWIDFNWYCRPYTCTPDSQFLASSAGNTDLHHTNWIAFREARGESSIAYTREARREIGLEDLVAQTRKRSVRSLLVCRLADNNYGLLYKWRLYPVNALSQTVGGKFWVASEVIKISRYFINLSQNKVGNPLVWTLYFSSNTNKLL